jgi:hypothetical protein
LSAFHCYAKISEKINLKEERLTLAFGFSPWSLASVTFGAFGDVEYHSELLTSKDYRNSINGLSKTFGLLKGRLEVAEQQRADSAT